MAEKEIDIYMIPTADFHNTEYVADYFKVREYMTGFTGSNGTAVFTKEKAGLWTDGRYFIQARQELAGSNIALYEMGEPGIPTVLEFLENELPEGGVIAFDGRTVGVNDGLQYEDIVEAKKGEIIFDLDLVGAFWSDRPELPCEPAFLLPENYAGESAAAKLIHIREVMAKEEVSLYLLTTLDDIGWLLNLRGNDIPCFPFVLSYLAIWENTGILYSDERHFDGEILTELEKLNISVKPYDKLYEDVEKLDSQEVVLLDPAGVNYTIYAHIPVDVIVLKQDNPLAIMKCVKNPVEADGIRQAHVKDGVANTKFMYWLKNHPDVSSLTELAVAEKIAAFRQEQELYLGPSFLPICAFREHAAIVHYAATEESNVNLDSDGLLLTDTGGHYLNGTTDITRTYVIGHISDEMKAHFTLVAKSMLKLSNVKFLYGCDGSHIDYATREAFWQKGLNYNHGTGHGVGHVGGVHEGPININWKRGKKSPTAFEENMQVTDEPGIYIEGSHGIRLENMLLVQKAEKNVYGQFMCFETLTLVPLDLDGIAVEYMNGEEIALLNAYHQKVYDTICPHLAAEEAKWLKKATGNISV